MMPSVNHDAPPAPVLDRSVMFDLGSALGTGYRAFLTTAALELERELNMLRRYAEGANATAFRAAGDRMMSVAAFIGAQRLTDDLREVLRGSAAGLDEALSRIETHVQEVTAELQAVAGINRPLQGPAT